MNDCSKPLPFFFELPKIHGGSSRAQQCALALFEVEKIPCDNHIRQTLDWVEPSHLFVLFEELHESFAQSGMLEAMRAVENTRLIALDGTWYFSSQSEGRANHFL
jgi:hypothetical protein